MTTLFLIAALLAGLGSVRSRPKTDPDAVAPVKKLSPDELRAEVDSYLGSIDTPISAARWRSLGPQAAPLLEPMIADAKELPTQRARALEGLVAVAPDRAQALVGRLAQSEDEPVVVRVAALHGAARLFGPRRLLAALKPVLEGAKEPGMRATAAEVLAHHGKAAGCSAVRTQVAREQDRSGFARALEHCE